MGQILRLHKIEDLIEGHNQTKLHIFMVVSQSTKYMHTSYCLIFLITESSKYFNKIICYLAKTSQVYLAHNKESINISFLDLPADPLRGQTLWNFTL